MRFLYYLFIVKRRLMFMTIILVTAVTAWGMKASVERAVVSNDSAPVEQVQSVLERSVLTDWDMCAQFHPEVIEASSALNQTLIAQQSATNGQLNSLHDLIEQCARVTVPLTGQRAALARRNAGMSE